MRTPVITAVIKAPTQTAGFLSQRRLDGPSPLPDGVLSPVPSGVAGINAPHHGAHRRCWTGRVQADRSSADYTTGPRGLSCAVPSREAWLRATRGPRESERGANALGSRPATADPSRPFVLVRGSPPALSDLDPPTCATSGRRGRFKSGHPDPGSRPLAHRESGLSSLSNGIGASPPVNSRAAE
jgi:hypothetical protein